MSLKSLFPKKYVSRQALTILSSWKAYSLSLPIAYWDPQTIFSTVYTLSLQQTQNMQDINEMQKEAAVALLLKELTKAGNETQSFASPSSYLARGLFGFILDTVQPKKFK